LTYSSDSYRRRKETQRERDRTKILNTADEVGKPITSHNKAYGAASIAIAQGN
jgi:hypothetical protein